MVAGVVWGFMVEGLWRVANLEVLAVKSFGPMRILVYCNGVYLFVEVDGLGFFTTSATVGLWGTWGLNSNEDASWWLLPVFMEVWALFDPSGGP